MQQKQCSIIIKIGGSLLSNNSLISDDYIKSLCYELLKCERTDIILIHGGGSITKNIFLSNNIEGDFLCDNNMDIIQSFYQNIDLVNNSLINSLNKFDIACDTIQPRFISKSINGTVSYFNFDSIISLLNKKIIPVLHGDIILDEIHNYYACSSDAFVPLLAEKFKPLYTIFLTDVNGIFENHPSNKNEDPFKSVDISILSKIKQEYKPGHSDMYGKLKYAFECLPFSDKCFIINGKIKNNLTNALNDNEFIGTTLTEI